MVLGPGANAAPQYQRPRPCQPTPTTTIAAAIIMINAVPATVQEHFALRPSPAAHEIAAPELPARGCRINFRQSSCVDRQRIATLIQPYVLRQVPEQLAHVGERAQRHHARNSQRPGRGRDRSARFARRLFPFDKDRAAVRRADIVCRMRGRDRHRRHASRLGADIRSLSVCRG